MSPPRTRFRARLSRLTNGRLASVTKTGSRSLIEVSAAGPFVFLRTGTLDRERRLFTRIPSRDAAMLLARPDSVVVILIKELVGQPLVVPASILLADARPNADVPIHVRVERGGAITVCETGLDLAPYLGWPHAERLVAKASASGACGNGVRALSHQEWQGVVAAIGRRRGYEVYVPAADRSRVCTHLVREAGGDARFGLGAMDALPVAVRGLRRLRHVDVILSRPAATLPALVIEVERQGDVNAALARMGDVLAALRVKGLHPLPRFVIVADGSRRGEFEEKVSSPLYTGPAGLAARCAFWPLERVMAEYERGRGDRDQRD